MAHLVSGPASSLLGGAVPWTCGLLAASRWSWSRASRCSWARPTSPSCTPSAPYWDHPQRLHGQVWCRGVQGVWGALGLVGVCGLCWGRVAHCTAHTRIPHPLDEVCAVPCAHPHGAGVVELFVVP
jgi:hypothetical protein